MAFKDSSKGAQFTVITFDIGQIELHSYRSTTKEPQVVACCGNNFPADPNCTLKI